MRTVLLFLALIGLAGCEESVEQTDRMDAVTFFTGDPAVDGCGWLLITEQDTLSPVNLDSEFHEDSLKVRIRYKKLSDSVFCAWRKTGYKSVELTDIVRN